MKFKTVMLTAPRPASLLERTTASLIAGGFDPWVFDGSPPNGTRSSINGCTSAYRNLFRCAMPFLLEGEGLLVFEDDVIVCKGLREYLERCEWPEPQDKIAAVSPYCCTAYSNYGVMGRWHREDGRPSIAGTQAFIYTRHMVELLADYLSPALDGNCREQFGVDVQIGWCAKKAGLHLWYHVPSGVQHCGIRNSSVGYTDDLGTIYSAETFPGEDFDMRSLPNG